MKQSVTQMEDVLERIKQAYLSDVLIVWLLVRDKEVADRIVMQFSDIFLGPDGGESGPLQLDGIVPAMAPKAGVYYMWSGSGETRPGYGNKVDAGLERFLDLALDVKSSSDYKEYAEALEAGKRNKADLIPFGRSIVIVAAPYEPSLGWLNSYIKVISVPNLNDFEIEGILADISHEDEITIDGPLMDRLVVNLRGLSEREIRQVMRKSIESGYFNGEHPNQDRIMDVVWELKRQSIENVKGLKWYDRSENTIMAAGMGAIDKWLSENKVVFMDPEKSRRIGYSVPKGMLMTGIPGTGKSLMAMNAASILGVPMVQLNFRDLLEGVVGESENHLREALRRIDGLGPCLLRIDEIEKCFAGSGQDRSDGGVMQGMFGKFLTWMQEKNSFCFVFATSNDITELPSALFRSERFDKKFFNFMPSAEDCSMIFAENIKACNARMKAENGEARLRYNCDLEKAAFWQDLLDDKAMYDYNAESGSDRRVKEEVVIDGETGTFAGGRVPQRKLMTGADITLIVNQMTNRLLMKRAAGGAGEDTPFTMEDVNSVFGAVIDDCMPYGQTNLTDIAECFLSMSRCRFSPSSNTATILSFSDIDSTSGKVKTFREDKFPNDPYNRTLYRCIVGAVNGLANRTVQK